MFFNQTSDQCTVRLRIVENSARKGHLIEDGGKKPEVPLSLTSLRDRDNRTHGYSCPVSCSPGLSRSRHPGNPIRRSKTRAFSTNVSRVDRICPSDYRREHEFPHHFCPKSQSFRTNVRSFLNPTPPYLFRMATYDG